MLDKDPESAELSIRPIGVEEVIPKMVGKTIIWSLNGEIQLAACPLQVASDLKGDGETAIHSMKLEFEDEASDAILLVDAKKGFNRLNRLAVLHNIQFICPPFAAVLINTYRTSAHLILGGGGEGALPIAEQGFNLTKGEVQDAPAILVTLRSMFIYFCICEGVVQWLT